MIHEQAATPRTRRRRANRERILDAALEVVSAEGIDALSIKKVADVADYTPGALYRYFPSKDALLASVAAHVIEELGGRLAKVEGLGVARVRAQADGYIRFSREEPHRFALIATMFGDPRVLLPEAQEAAKVGAAMHAALLPVAAALAIAVERGELSPGAPEDRVLTLFAGLQGALQMRKQQRVMPALLYLREGFSNPPPTGQSPAGPPSEFERSALAASARPRGLEKLVTELLDAERLAKSMVETLLVGWGAKI